MISLRDTRFYLDLTFSFFQVLHARLTITTGGKICAGRHLLRCPPSRRVVRVSRINCKLSEFQTARLFSCLARSSNSIKPKRCFPPPRRKEPRTTSRGGSDDEIKIRRAARSSQPGTHAHGCPLRGGDRYGSQSNSLGRRFLRRENCPASQRNRPDGAPASNRYA